MSVVKHLPDFYFFYFDAFLFLGQLGTDVSNGVAADRVRRLLEMLRCWYPGSTGMVQNAAVL